MSRVVARERLDPLQAGEPLVVEGELPLADLRVRVEPVELDERDRREDVGEVGLEARGRPGRSASRRRVASAACSGSPRRRRLGSSRRDLLRPRRCSSSRRGRSRSRPRSIRSCGRDSGSRRRVQRPRRRAARGRGSGRGRLGWPPRWTGMTAFVRSVTSSGIRDGSMLRSLSRTSQKTGVAPQCSITLAVAGHVIGLVITSSPGPTPSARRARCSAAVPDASASTCSASRYAAIRSSSSAARGPVVSQPERSVSATAATSSSPIAGGWKPSLVALRELRRVDIDQEAYGLGRTASACERPLAALADGEHGARPVGTATERNEAPAGSAIRPHPLDPVGGGRLRHALGRPEHPGRRDEKRTQPPGAPTARGSEPLGGRPARRAGRARTTRRGRSGRRRSRPGRARRHGRPPAVRPPPSRTAPRRNRGGSACSSGRSRSRAPRPRPRPPRRRRLSDARSATHG